MSEPNYLTVESKIYYLAEMEKCRKLRDSSDSEAREWAMDERLEEAMAEINRFNGLQTMLSLFPQTADEARQRLELQPHFPLMYIQVAYADYVEEALLEALKEAYAEKGIARIYEMSPEPCVYPDPPDDLLEIDAACNQERYLSTCNKLVFVAPGEEAGVSSGSGDEEILDAFRAAFERLVKVFVDVGMACEGNLVKHK